MSIVKLQIPMQATLRDGLEKRAEKLGFDSVQAYIRFWAKAEVDERQVDFGDDWGEPSPKAIARWEKQVKQHEADRKAGKVKSFDNVAEALAYLRSQ